MFLRSQVRIDSHTNGLVVQGAYHPAAGAFLCIGGIALATLLFTQFSNASAEGVIVTIVVGLAFVIASLLLFARQTVIVGYREAVLQVRYGIGSVFRSKDYPIKRIRRISAVGNSLVLGTASGRQVGIMKIDSQSACVSVAARLSRALEIARTHIPAKGEESLLKSRRSSKRMKRIK